jgi:predicted transcriptional regulator
MLAAVKFSSAPWVLELTSDDPLVAAKLRGLNLRQQLLKTSGGALASERVADVLNISRQAVDTRRASNQLLALTQGRRGYSYPSFQFDEGMTIKGLEEVLGKLSAIDPWMQLNFFTSPNERLGGSSPIEAL